MDEETRRIKQIVDEIFERVVRRSFRMTFSFDRDNARFNGAVAMIRIPCVGEEVVLSEEHFDEWHGTYIVARVQHFAYRSDSPISGPGATVGWMLLALKGSGS